MVSRGADVTFQDAKKEKLAQFSRQSGQKVCAVLPGSKKGKKIILPDAKRYTQYSDFKIIDNLYFISLSGC